MSREKQTQHAYAHGHDQHPHEHAHNLHDHDHGKHSHPTGVLGWVATVFHWHGHSHDHAATGNDVWQRSAEGIRTVWIALAALGITSLLQIGIVLVSGSIALFADTIHNIGDTLNSIPLLAAFYLARRAATRRYTYGYGRAEDVAGLFIVLSIAFSAVVIFWESFQKLFNPQPIENLGWVTAAAIIGFLGNEAVAVLQIRVGRRIGSDAMIADGLHARIDGLTSLVVLGAVVGTLIGLPILDPIIGLLIGVTILFITRDAARRMWYRLLDAVDPRLIDEIEHAAEHVPQVGDVGNVRARWIGNQLQVELTITLPTSLTFAEADQARLAVENSLRSHIPQLGVVYIETRLDEAPRTGSAPTVAFDSV